MGVPAGTLRQVYDSLDFDALEAAGIANPRERAGLLTYLDELGFTVEEMV
ncbi:adenylate cyclase [Mycobacterium tuberculosis]|nr:adenylate cyclase [Mycobacterium tuberculosis]CFI98435.1 adenylate cyclase [Mycobacterium tuberculosis]